MPLCCFCWLIAAVISSSVGSSFSGQLAEKVLLAESILPEPANGLGQLQLRKLRLLAGGLLAYLALHFGQHDVFSIHCGRNHAVFIF